MSMPTPVPGARRIAFSDAAADRAVADIEGLSDALRGLRRAEAEAVTAPAADWRGPAREEFDARRSTRLDVLDSAIVRLDVLRSQIIQHRAQAAFEQVRANQMAELERQADVARLLAAAGS